MRCPKCEALNRDTDELCSLCGEWLHPNVETSKHENVETAPVEGGRRRGAGGRRIKLALAVMLLVASIWAVIAGLAAREMTRNYEAAMRSQTEALNAEREKVEALKKVYLAAANARWDYHGETLDEVARAVSEAQRIAERTGVDAITAATVAGEVAGIGLTGKEQEQYTILRAAGRVERLDPKMPGGLD